MNAIIGFCDNSSLSPSETFAPPPKIWSENNRKLSVTNEICMTIDFAPSAKKIPGRKPGSSIYGKKIVSEYSFGSWSKTNNGFDTVSSIFDSAKQ